MVTVDKIFPIIILGIISTILVFWSLSGFILKVVQTRKKIYLKDVNMFVLRQLNNKINTTVISMSLICLMLFMTISVLSSSLSLNSNNEKRYARNDTSRYQSLQNSKLTRKLSKSIYRCNRKLYRRTNRRL